MNDSQRFFGGIALQNSVLRLGVAAVWRTALATSVLVHCWASVSITQADEAQIRPLPPIDPSVETVAFYDAFLTENREPDRSDLSIEQRLGLLEGNYSVLSNSYNDLSSENVALKKQLKGMAFTGHKGSTMKVNGRVHVDQWAFPNSSPAINIFENNNDLISPQDHLGFRRLRFGVKGDLWKTMFYKIEMELAGGNKTEFRDAYIGMKDVPFFQKVVVGNQKRPYGLDHLNSSRFNVFIERPVVIESINQDSRRFGIQSYNVSDDEAWNWRYGVFNQRLIQDEGNYISDHYQMEVAGRLANTFWYDETSGGRGYGHWAVSGTAANTDGNGSGLATNEARFRSRPEARSVNRWIDTGVIAGADNYEMLGLENVWNFGPLQLVGEYQNLWLDRDAGTSLHFDGGYAYISYFLTGEHIPWKRSSGTLDRVKPIENFFLVDTSSDGVRGGWGAWQLAYRFSYANFNDENIFGGRGISHTLGVNWHWNPYTRVQFNAIYGEIADRNGFDDADDDPNTANVATCPISGNYTIIGTRFMVDF